MIFERLVGRIERAERLDPLVSGIRSAVSELLKDKDLKDQLNGVALGHPLHPALVHLPIGALASASILDLLPRSKGSATALVGIGLLSAVPTSAAGAADFVDLRPKQGRVALVHMAANSVGLACYATSWWHRVRGRRLKGRAYGFAGLGFIGVGGFLGGHLAYHQAVGANHAEQVPDVVPEGWTAVAQEHELVDGQPVTRMCGEVPVMLLRKDGEIYALADMCAHSAGPLHDGELSNGDGELCVTCPWHGSTFRLSDGAVVHGPATASQPAFTTRVVDGTVEVAIAGT
jgi:nitrite reductase/ring-hydroxylating ferredoxin subunit/uncharacterized membrane protein